MLSDSKELTSFVRTACVASVIGLRSDSMPRPKSRSKPHPEVEKTISELRAWCAAEPGRQTEIAQFLGVTRQSVNDWLNQRRDDSATPTVDRFFEIRDFLKAQRGKKAK